MTFIKDFMILIRARPKMLSDAAAVSPTPSSCVPVFSDYTTSVLPSQKNDSLVQPKKEIEPPEPPSTINTPLSAPTNVLQVLAPQEQVTQRASLLSTTSRWSISIKNKFQNNMNEQMKTTDTFYKEPRTFAEFDEWFEHCRDPRVISKLSKLRDTQQKDPRTPLILPAAPKGDVLFMNTCILDETKRIQKEKYLPPLPSSTCRTRSPMILDVARLQQSYALFINNCEDGLTMRVPKQILMIIRLLPGNSRCCDCGCANNGATNNNAEFLAWAHVAHGTVLCEECALQNMRRGSDDDIKSFETDLDWKFTEIISMLEGGNEAFWLERSFAREETKSNSRDGSSSSRYRKTLKKKVSNVVSLLEI